MTNPFKKLSTFIKNPFASVAEKALRNKFNEAFLGIIGGGYTQYDAEAITYLDDGYNVNPIVYAVINQQATKTASIPYTVRKLKDKQAQTKLNRLKLATKEDYTPQQTVQRILLESKAYEENELEFPMEAPNANQSWAEFLALYKTFLKLTGNVYVYLLAPEEGQNKGEPIQVYLLPSQYMQIIVDSNADDIVGVESAVRGYMLTYGRSYIEFEAENVIHIKYTNPNYGQNGEHLYGQSPLKAALRILQSTDTALDLNIKTLKSGGAFGFIHAKQTPLTKEQADELKDRMLEMDNNTDRLAKIAGFSAEVGFTRLSLTSDELKPFDYLKFNEKQICNVLGWSDKLLNNDDGAKYDNVSQFRRLVITDNIMPDLKLLTEAFNKHFLPRFKGYEGTYWDFDFTQLPEMQINVKELSEWLNSALDRGVVTRNEYRTAINYTTSEDKNLDVFTVASDIMSLDESLDTTFSTDTGEKSWTETKAGFDPNQPRGKDGQWGSDGMTLEKLKEENKDTLPKISTDDVFLNKKESLGYRETSELDKLIDANKVSEIPIKTVNISDIVPTQKNININNLKDVVGADLINGDDVILFQKGTKYYVIDGHHRISDRILEGVKTIKVRVYKN